MNEIKVMIPTRHHFGKAFLLKNITSNIAGTKLNEFGRISSMRKNPANEQKIPHRGNCLEINAP